MRKSSLLAAGALSLVASIQAQAELPLDFHLSGQAAHIKIKSSNESLAPNVFQLRGEVALNEGMFAGIGLLGLVATPINDAQKHGTIGMDITQQSAAYITLTNPETEKDELRFSVLLGYASTEVETKAINLGSSYSDTFSGFSYGFALQDQILPKLPLYWSLNCTSYFRDDHLRIEGCGLGATYAF
jgi:hypothetical protein